MGSRSSDDGLSVSVILAILVLVAMVVGVVAAIVEGQRVAEFDRAFEQGSILLNGKMILMGETANPTTEAFDDAKVPDGGLVIGFVPRTFTAGADCVALSLPKGGLMGVKAITEFPNPDVVTIIVPLYDVGSLLLCGPKGGEVTVVLWALKATTEQ